MSAAPDLRVDTLTPVETPEGIVLSLRPAGLVSRSMAFLLDLMFRLIIDSVLAVALLGLGRLGVGLFLIGMFAVEWLYPIFFELTRAGATPGKRVFGLRVVMDNGLPITPAASVTRNLLRAADFLPVAYTFGIITLLLNRDCKRLGDLAAGTLVVYAAPVVLHDQPPEAPSLAPARPLNQQEQAAIRAWAGRARRLTPQRFEELAQLAAPVLPPQDPLQAQNPLAPRRNASDQLLGVAQWLMGKRA
ncbi:RDD family protein [Roseateles terrae]|uniref:RDD family membrane protein YckC n=1 Tax=Roseateles terrae TaxID=431060 RepID=A0ABR6GT94_9BURK|nr:RDD family protein [Roseateles terrae]MBB3195323.1 putative RDD family membrane protein YckC [Roseateles terrae]